MSVPTISAVSPTTGPTTGDFLVTLTGTNFRTPAITPGAATTPVTVSVLIGGIAATDIEVVSDTTLRCVVPALVAKVPSSGNDAPLPRFSQAVSIVLTNLDDSGVPIAGETVTLASALTYATPLTTSDQESVDGDLARLARALIQLFKRTLAGVDVTHSVQTDYDPTTGDELHVTKFASLPGITLVGPELSENRFFSLNEQPDFDDPSSPVDDAGNHEGFVTTRVPYTVDVVYTLIGASNRNSEQLLLMQNVIALMHRTKYLALARSETDPTQVEYEFDFVTGQQPRSTTVPNSSNLRTFSCQIVVRGFDIEGFAGLDAGRLGGVPKHAIVKQGNVAENVVLDPTVQTGIS